MYRATFVGKKIIAYDDCIGLWRVGALFRISADPLLHAHLDKSRLFHLFKSDAIVNRFTWNFNIKKSYVIEYTQIKFQLIISFFYIYYVIKNVKSTRQYFDTLYNMWRNILRYHRE